MTKARKLAFYVVPALATLLATGYLTSYAALGRASDESFRQLRREGLVGRDMAGTQTPILQNAVTSRIAGPFLVETTFLVPYDLHGSLHTTRYLVLPWAIRPLSTRIIDLV